MSTTESAAYTLGPWHYCSEPETKPYEFYVRESVSGWDNPVAHVRFNCPESEANARLIAAAPELLEALKGMIELERHTHRLPDTINRDWMDGIINDAKAAIRKAESQS